MGQYYRLIILTTTFQDNRTDTTLYRHDKQNLNVTTGLDAKGKPMAPGQ